MTPELKSLLVLYRQTLASSKSENFKIEEVKMMSQLLRNELYDMFSEALGSKAIEDYNEFTAMGENLLSGPLSGKVSLGIEDGQMMLYLEKRKKRFLSAKELSQAVLDTSSNDLVDLYSIFLSNDSDLLRLNILF